MMPRRRRSKLQVLKCKIQLLQAEKILHAFTQNINDKLTMHVNNKSDFVNALNNLT